ncbi:hypothetical protein [Spiroplasma alleghenense]|uniref:Transmembrane protein n=1 Tax=Spiroplasma alleghenense TaxID=216931 RepID=A0A345Z4Z3_9MOLU|nr:hypothetical protein [Spiroplasma alleghenense]AXK51672.1 hypothetical protein SALLE_v1c10020 [Spiroplasma alleghenense]
MKKLSNKKYLLLGIFGSAALILSSSTVLAHSLSKSNENFVFLQDKLDFTKQNIVKEQFKKAEIPLELEQNYLEILSNLNNFNLRKKLVNEADFIDATLAIQNELSSRLVTKNLSESELRKQIGLVKEILMQNIKAYEKVVDNDDYAQLSKIEFFKYNFNEWTSMNQVDKYRLIYDYRENLKDYLENLNELKDVNQEILKRKISKNNEIIKLNSKKIFDLNDEIVSTNENTKKLLEYKKEVGDAVNLLISNLNEEKSEKKWTAVNYGISMGLGAATIGLLATSIFMPWFFIPAKLSSLSFTVQTGIVGKSFNALALKQGFSIKDASAIWTGRTISLRLSKYIKNIEKDIFSSKDFNLASKSLWNKALAVFAIILTAVTMVDLTLIFVEFEKTISGYFKDIWDLINKANSEEMDTINQNIKKYDHGLYLLEEEKTLLEKDSLEKQFQIDGYSSEYDNLENSFSNFEEIFSNGGLFQKDDFNFNLKKNDFQNYSDDELKSRFQELKSQRYVKSNQVQDKYNKFINEYNYNDKDYWKTVFLDIFGFKLQSLENIFY